MIYLYPYWKEKRPLQSKMKIYVPDLTLLAFLVYVFLLIVADVRIKCVQTFLQNHFSLL